MPFANANEIENNDTNDISAAPRNTFDNNTKTLVVK